MEKAHILGMDVMAIAPGLMAKVAHMGDDVQAAIFEAFAKELLASCETHYAAERQAMFIRDKLSREARDIFASIGYEPDGDDL